MLPQSGPDVILSSCKMASRHSTETNVSRSAGDFAEISRTETSITDDATGGPPTQEEIQRKPWKFIGYKGYADFIASDNDFLILRRFGTLSARVALSLQDEISELEHRLGEYDAKYSDRNARDVNNGTFRDELPDRKELFQIIADKICRYSKYISVGCYQL